MLLAVNMHHWVMGSHGERSVPLMSMSESGGLGGDSDVSEDNQ